MAELNDTTLGYGYNPPAKKVLAASPMTAAQQASVASYSQPSGTSLSSFSSSPSPYIAPVQNYAGPASNPYRSAPMPSMQQAPAQQQSFTPTPPPAPSFASGGRQEFNMFSPEQQQMSEQQWLGGDSDYTAQTGLYQKALDDFVRRITGRIEGFDQDAVTATNANLKNETMSANSLGSDFGARGLSYSGLFDQSKNKLLDRYKEGRGNIEKNKTMNVQNARNEEADYRSENEIGQTNARRSSLLRMAAQQQLLDSQFGM